MSKPNKPTEINLLTVPTLSWKFIANGKSLTLQGCSGASDRTAFHVPELAVALDYGFRACNKKPDIVCISHTHSDHISSIYHCRSRNKPPKILLPSESVKYVEDYFEIATIMTSHGHFATLSEDERSENCKLIGCHPNDVIKHKGMEIKSIECFHRIPCRGYIFYEVKKKLREDLKGKTPAEIAVLARSGEQVSVPTKSPYFAFLGDTTSEVFRKSPELFECPVIIVECTSIGAHFEDEDIEAKRGHIQWDRLKPFVVDNPQCTFVLTHFSKRYKPREVKEFFEKEDMPNVVPWLL